LPFGIYIVSFRFKILQMKNFVLLSMLALTLFTGSCIKNTNPPLSYLVDTMHNVYVNQNDSFHMKFDVRFLTGNSQEMVALTIKGLPAHVRLAKDTIKGTPTFTADFLIYADSGAALGNYPVTLVCYSSSTGYREISFNLGVVNYLCGYYVKGSYTGTNSCRATSYVYPATATSSGDTAVSVVNIGGYGVNTNTFVRLDCNTDSVYVDRQNIGNGITMWGHGRFTANSIVVHYIALNVPGGYNDTCTAILSR
jgi:hypothetical protein